MAGVDSLGGPGISRWHHADRRVEGSAFNDDIQGGRTAGTSSDGGDARGLSLVRGLRGAGRTEHEVGLRMSDGTEGE